MSINECVPNFVVQCVIFFIENVFKLGISQIVSNERCSKCEYMPQNLFVLIHLYRAEDIQSGLFVALYPQFSTLSTFLGCHAKDHLY